MEWLRRVAVKEGGNGEAGMFLSCYMLRASEGGAMCEVLRMASGLGQLSEP